ncbi:glycosyltransferase [Nakamurella sp. YIM 132087]|uniref:Glycosyltransferase n=1 Tax=Nakamurella alba TaxID=2665158 RepID=A0A7K1FMI9_9ACTN|nr:glycosyltransferase [Nakamurella alba]
MQSAGETPVRHRICLVGPGFRFLGGLSVYTCRLATALAEQHDVSVITLDRLLPARFYPGGHRVGQQLSVLRYPDTVQQGPSVDWWWGRTIARAVAHLRRERPEVLLLQWWTAATLHTYLALAIAAKRLGIPVVIEFHELQDTGEAGIPLIGPYRALLMPRLLKLASGALVHNQHDLEMLQDEYRDHLDHLAVEIAPHGPYDHLGAETAGTADAAVTEDADGADGVTRLLFFGLIRPYKGAEDLVEAFNALTAEEAARFRLTVVGETWEGHTRPADLIRDSPHRDRIEFVNRYVSDTEAAGFFADADAVVLPYRRGSASGPLQIAMSNGLHVLLYAVGGLVEAVRDYPGAVLLPPDDVIALGKAIRSLPERRGERFEDPHSWSATLDAVSRLAAAVHPGQVSSA